MSYSSGLSINTAQSLLEKEADGEHNLFLNSGHKKKRIDIFNAMNKESQFPQQSVGFETQSFDYNSITQPRSTQADQFSHSIPQTTNEQPQNHLGVFPESTEPIFSVNNTIQTRNPLNNPQIQDLSHTIKSASRFSTQLDKPNSNAGMIDHDPANESRYGSLYASLSSSIMTSTQSTPAYPSVTIINPQKCSTLTNQVLNREEISYQNAYYSTLSMVHNENNRNTSESIHSNPNSEDDEHFNFADVSFITPGASLLPSRTQESTDSLHSFPTGHRRQLNYETNEQISQNSVDLRNDHSSNSTHAPFSSQPCLSVCSLDNTTSGFDHSMQSM